MIFGVPLTRFMLNGMRWFVRDHLKWVYTTIWLVAWNNRRRRCDEWTVLFSASESTDNQEKKLFSNDYHSLLYVFFTDSVFVVHIVWNNEKSMPMITVSLWKAAAQIFYFCLDHTQWNCLDVSSVTLCGDFAVHNFFLLSHLMHAHSIAFVSTSSTDKANS